MMVLSKGSTFPTPHPHPGRSALGCRGLGHVLTSNWVPLKCAWGLQPYQSSMLAGGLLGAAPLYSLTCRLQASVLAKGALVAWAEVRRTEQGCVAAALRWRRKDRSSVKEARSRTRAQLRRKCTGKVCTGRGHWQIPGPASFCSCAGESPRSSAGPFKAHVTF